MNKSDLSTALGEWNLATMRVGMAEAAHQHALRVVAACEQKLLTANQAARAVRDQYAEHLAAAAHCNSPLPSLHITRKAISAELEARGLARRGAKSCADCGAGLAGDTGNPRRGRSQISGASRRMSEGRSPEEDLILCVAWMHRFVYRWLRQAALVLCPIIVLSVAPAFVCSVWATPKTKCSFVSIPHDISIDEYTKNPNECIPTLNFKHVGLRNMIVANVDANASAGSDYFRPFRDDSDIWMRRIAWYCCGYDDLGSHNIVFGGSSAIVQKVNFSPQTALTYVHASPIGGEQISQIDITQSRKDTGLFNFRESIGGLLSRVRSFIGYKDGKTQSDKLEYSDSNQERIEDEGPPIFRRLIFAIFLNLSGYGITARGICHFDNKRRVFCSTIIGCGGIIGCSGYFLILTNSFPGTWNWWF